MTTLPLRALVVEDDPASRHLLQEILQARGHEVDAFADGESAWTAFQRQRHPLVVLDWTLPGMDGSELCRRIRELPDAGDTFVLFVTGTDRRGALEEALEAGASDYLTKSALPEQVHVRLSIAERQLKQAAAQRQREAELVRDALHDPLTGLANRALFLERLERAAKRQGRAGGHLFSVLVVDLYEFREINRTHGRDVGDRILVDTARRLEDCVRGVDTVARLEGDDFAILLDGMKDVSDPTRVAHRVHQALTHPFRYEEQDVFVSACIGMALSITGFKDSPDLLRDAQTALVRARAEGRGSHQMYDPVMHARAMARLQLEGRIRRALDQDELMLVYQPVIHLGTGRVESLEALVRWNDPDRGLVRPEEFVPVAEDTGLTVPLGWWVLRTALGQLADWRSSLPGANTLAVSINLSSRQFNQPDIFDQVGLRLEESGLPGSALNLEITEASIMSDAPATTRTLQRLKEGAVRLHVDDFGTGYSSLSYLCRFPIDALKVDRTFVTQMTHSPGNLEVVRTIVRLARNLEMDVIAEGVETEAQRRLLEEMGCDFVQGFLFSRPLRAEQVPDWLARTALA